MLVKYTSIDGVPQAFLFFWFVDIIVITVYDHFWNVGQANCILKYFENKTHLCLNLIQQGKYNVLNKI
jgi:phosphate starvation-inducible membrane PsiE